MLRTIAVATALSAGLAGSGVPPANPLPSTDADSSSALGSSDPANPLVLYPRRAGAQYGDIEVPYGETAHVDGTRVALQSATIEPGPPPAPEPTPSSAMRTLGSPVRGFDPVLTGTPDTVLHLSLTSDTSELVCTLSAGADGASTSQIARVVDTDTVELFFAIGTRRGRFYTACSPMMGLVLSGLVQRTPARAVWGFDV